MSYAKIENLYKSQEILLFRECYAMEKIHGTSTRINWNNSALTFSLPLTFSSGGCSHIQFVGIFDILALETAFTALGHSQVTVYGEGYGGKLQGMRATYGDKLRFVAFEVRIGDSWLSVPQAEDVCKKLGLEFVHYLRIPATIEAIDAERDAPSAQAVRNGIAEPKSREGVVLRPLIELVKNNGERIIAKHKIEIYHERKNQPGPDVDPEKFKALSEAEAIADEWVVPRRLEHVLQKFPGNVGMEQTASVIAAMVADVYAEAKGEIVESKAVDKAIGQKTAQLLRAYCQQRLRIPTLV